MLKDKQATKKRCFYKMERKDYHYIIFMLICLNVAVVILRLSNDMEMVNIISIGAGVTSIVLGIVAIIYSIIINESAKQKETNVSGMLEDIKANVVTVTETISKIENYSIKNQDYLRVIDRKVSVSEKEKLEMKNEYLEEAQKSEVKEESNPNIEDIEVNFEINTKSKDKAADTNEIEAKQGDIVLADIGEGLLSEFASTRPCIVVSNNIQNKYAPMILVVPITTKANRKPIATHTVITGLKCVTFACGERLMNIHKNRVIKKIGTVSKEEMLSVYKSINIALGEVEERTE